MSSAEPSVSWKAIRRDVLQNIQSGHWKPGEKIPREAELAEQYRCTRSTVGRALRDLALAGYLDRRRKGGTTVSPNPTRKAPLEVPIIRDAIRKAGHEAGYRPLKAELATPPQEIAAALGFAAELLNIQALYLADDRPFQIEDRWLVPAMVRGLGPDHWLADPVDEWLLQNAPLTRAQIAIESVTPPEAVARLFNQSPATSSLLVTRVSWQQLRPLGFLQLYHAAGFRIETGI